MFWVIVICNQELFEQIIVWVVVNVFFYMYAKTTWQVIEGSCSLNQIGMVPLWCTRFAYIKKLEEAYRDNTNLQFLLSTVICKANDLY